MAYINVVEERDLIHENSFKRIPWIFSSLQDGIETVSWHWKTDKMLIQMPWYPSELLVSVGQGILMSCHIVPFVCVMWRVHATGLLIPGPIWLSRGSINWFTKEGIEANWSYYVCITVVSHLADKSEPRTSGSTVYFVNFINFITSRAGLVQWEVPLLSCSALLHHGDMIEGEGISIGQWWRPSPAWVI